MHKPPRKREHIGQNYAGSIKSEAPFGDDSIFDPEPPAPGGGNGNMVRCLLEALIGGMSASNRGGDTHHRVAKEGRNDQSRRPSCATTRRATSSNVPLKNV